MADAPTHRDQGSWARRVERLSVGDVPPGGPASTVDRRQLAGPLQGFGQLWHKPSRVRHNFPNIRHNALLTGAFRRRSRPSNLQEETR